MSASVALALVGLIESVVLPSAVAPPAVALGALVGVGIGLALGALQLLALGFRGAAKRVVWLVAGLLAGFWLAHQLGALPKLQGQHRGMALLVLFGAPCAGALLGLVLFQLHASLQEQRRRRAAALAAWVGLGLTAVLGAEVAATLPVLGGYPAAKRALLVSSWLCAGAATGAVLQGLPQDARRARIGGAFWCLIVLGMLPLLRLTSYSAELLLQRPHAGAFLEVARSCSDFDHDGASGLLAGGDCAPFDARVGPMRPEIPGNGLDDNCRFGDAKKPTFAAKPSGSVPAIGPLVRHVLLVTVDALRADHVGAYGYARATTPHLDAWAARARRFEHAYTSGGWTCLALNSLFTGLYPRRLRWDVVGATAKDRLVPFSSQGRAAPDDDAIIALSALAGSPGPSFPELLRAKGLATAAVLGGVVPPQLFDYKGWLARSFERVVRLKDDHDDRGVTDTALQITRELGDAPWFLWAHYFEPHHPPGRHPETQDLGSSMVDEYDRDVAYTDLQIGRLLDGIGGDPAATLVIVTADHGETFDAVIPSHGLDLDRAQIWIPLFVSGPGVTSGVEKAATSLVDLAPTILAATGSAPLPFGDGQDLRGPLAAKRVVLSDLWRRGLDGRVFIDLVAASDASGSIIHDRLHQTFRGFGDGAALETAIGAYLEEPTQAEDIPP